MTHRHAFRFVSVCAAAAAVAFAASASLGNEVGSSGTAVQSAPSAPLNLNPQRKKPVVSSATRTIKKKNGEYAKVTVKRRVKQQAVAKPSPETLSPAAAQAFAAYELAKVRVVTPETTGSAALLASAATTIVGIDSVQVVSAEQINDIDRKADSHTAVSLDALSRDLAGSGQHDFAAVQPQTISASWYERLWSMVGDAFTAFASMVRSLVA